MRRESSTVVVLIGEVDDRLLTGIAQSPNVSVARAPAGWSAMWDVSAGPDPATGFETRAADALAAWKDKRFELPDYYVVVVPAHGSGQNPDLYLGPLRSVRPRRVAVAGTRTLPSRPA